MLLPLVLRILFPTTYHHFDVNTFAQWGGYHDHLSALYGTDCYCNYPYVGLLLYTVLIKLLGGSITAFLFAMALVDVLNVFLMYRILRMLAVPRAALFAGIIGILPATWIGGGFWGQIDTVGQTYLLLMFALIIQHAKIKRGHTRMYALYGFLFSLGVLTKQLLLFPMAPIAIYLIFRVFAQATHPRSLIRVLGAMVAAFLLPIIVIDLFVEVPDRFVFSHLERVFLEGSDHMNEISGNGFNLWMFFFPTMESSSQVSIIGGISPKLVGLILFVGLFGYLTYKHYLLHKTTNLTSVLLIGLLFYFLLINLGFNLLLTGTHERYLYHFYPFLFLLLLYAGRLHFNFVARIDFILALSGGLIYGLFVLGILQKYHLTTTFFGDLYAHRLLALFHLLLFIRLLYLYHSFNRSKHLVTHG